MQDSVLAALKTLGYLHMSKLATPLHITPFTYYEQQLAASQRPTIQLYTN